MAPFLSKPGRLVPIPAAANQSLHSGGSYKLGWEAWSQQSLSAWAGPLLPLPAVHRPWEVGRQASGHAAQGPVRGLPRGRPGLLTGSKWSV